MIEEIISQIEQIFPLEKKDAGEFASFKVSPMHVTTEWYEAQKLGNVSVIHGTALLGLMKMETLVITPFFRDAPLFSFDYISVLGNYTLLTEYYDTMLNASGFDTSGMEAARKSITDIPDLKRESCWFDSIRLSSSFAKKTKKGSLARLQDAFGKGLNFYLNTAAHLPELTEELSGQKRAKDAAYVNGLLEKGGSSTKVFIKAIGIEKTRKFFNSVMFGIGN